jgi:hypothetical protein
MIWLIDLTGLGWRRDLVSIEGTSLVSSERTYLLSSVGSSLLSGLKALLLCRSGEKTSQLDSALYWWNWFTADSCSFFMVLTADIWFPRLVTVACGNQNKEIQRREQQKWWTTARVYLESVDGGYDWGQGTKENIVVGDEDVVYC